MHLDGVWSVRLLADVHRARARGGDVRVLALHAFGAGCSSGVGEVTRLALQSDSGSGGSGRVGVKPGGAAVAECLTRFSLVLARLVCDTIFTVCLCLVVAGIAVGAGSVA
jgi:hypothetical protein